MAKPRLKRNRQNYVVVPAPTIPAAQVLKRCPLPAELRHLEPILNGPFGTAVLTTIGAALAEGLSTAEMERAVEQVVEFYSASHHRCVTCFDWSAESIAGALILDGRFVITAICQKCAKLARAGRSTEAMTRNMQCHVFGGG